MTSTSDIELATDAGADAVGVISEVSVDSPREVDTDTAAALIEHAPPFVTTVLVTMPDSAAEALALIEDIRPDAIQIHGELDTGEIRTIAAKRSVIQAVGADDEGTIREVAPIVDALLIDSLDEADGGGTGETHDWERARRRVATLDVPVILAGGLTPENVGMAVETVRPYGVDVASGVEGTNGKDPAAVRAFVEGANEVK